MWCAPPRRQHQLLDEPLLVGTLSVNTVNSIRDLGVYLDTNMSMGTHISKLVNSCFGILRQIRLRRSLTRSSLSTVITAFILSKVDYTAMLHCRVCRNVTLIDFNPPLSPQLVLRPIRADTITSRS